MDVQVDVEKTRQIGPSLVSCDPGQVVVQVIFFHMLILMMVFVMYKFAGFELNCVIRVYYDFS